MVSTQQAPRALRDVYGETLVELGERDPAIVVLDAGVSDSTKTILFGQRFPDRFFNAGIAEANQMDMAAGLALVGKKPFASTFAVFGAGRAWEQIRQSIAYSNLDVRIVCTHAGISIGEDGGSAQMIEDIALMRALPNMAVFCPADPRETRQVITALADWRGPAYVRLGRNPVDWILPEDYQFVPGKPVQLTAGDDVAIFATGLMVGMALEAQGRLAQEGIHARVLNISTLKPLDHVLVAEALGATGAAVTAEEHTILGGLGSAIAEIAGEMCPVPLVRVGVKDRFGQSGKPGPLLQEYGLTPEAIMTAARTAVDRKGL